MKRHPDLNAGADDLVSVAIVGSENPASAAKIVGLDADSLSLSVTGALPEGELVQLEAPSEMMLASVTKCESTPDGLIATLHITFSTSKKDLKELVKTCGGTAVVQPA